MSISRRQWILSAAARRSRPNIVLFLADDHGCHDSPLMGSRVIRARNLERIAASGTVYPTTFSGAAICIPSRAIIGSGLHSHRNGAVANGRQMKDGIKTLPSYMREQGYCVAHFGKSHFLPAANYSGWEAVKSEVRGEGPLNTDLDPSAVEAWLAAHAKDAWPLCLVVCCHSPHVTWEENSGYDPAQAELPPTFVDTPETRQARTRYYTDITKMDNQLGAVYDAVRRHLDPNSLFLYTSDNGAQWPFGKWNLYDAGIRLPLVASWPGVVRAGARSEAMLSFADLLPTFVELGGGKPPTDIDGRSFARVLTGGARKHRDEIYASHTADNNGQMNCYPMRCVRTRRCKYIRNLRTDLIYTTHIDRGVARDGREYWNTWVSRAKSDAKAAAVIRRYHQRPAEELYDIVADPHETNNLAANPDHAQTLGELRDKVAAWMKGMGDEGETWGTPRLLTSVPLPV